MRAVRFRSPCRRIDKNECAVMTTRRAVEILYADDDEDHVELIRIALQRSAANAVLHCVATGAECMSFLRREAPYERAPRPDILLLDISMPRMDGHEVMAEVAADPALCSLPVIVLTTSGAPPDVERMYSLRCSSYVRKPLDLEEFFRATQCLLDYWCTVVTLPQ